MRQCWFRLAWAIALLCVCFSTEAMAVPPLAGQVITNVAYCEFLDADGNLQVRQSNVVSVSVGKVSAVLIDGPRDKTAPIAAPFDISHEITNTGNVPASFDISISDLGGNFNFATLSLYADANGDGSPDGSALGTSWTTPVLSPGEKISFVIGGEIPSTASDGASAQINLSVAGNSTFATSSGSPTATAVSVVDTVTATSGADVELTASIVPTAGAAGAHTYKVTLTYANRGAGDASNVLIVDVLGYSSALRPFSQLLGAGAPDASYDTTGLSYVAGSAFWSGKASALTDVNEPDEGGVAYAYNTTTNTLTLQISSVAAGATGTLTFDAVLDDPFPDNVTKIVHRAGISYLVSPSSTAYGVSNPTTIDAASVLGKSETPASDIIVSALGDSAFYEGQQGSYRFQVSNQGNAATSGSITATIAIPAGMSYDGLDSSSQGYWMCGDSGSTAAGFTVTCVSNEVIAAGTTAVPSNGTILDLLVTPDANSFPSLPASVTVTAQVAGGGESSLYTSNDSATLTSQIVETGAISGKVWLDRNHDGVYTAGVDDIPSGWIATICVYDSSEDAGYPTSIVQDSSGQYVQEISGTARPSVVDCTPDKYVVAAVPIDAQGDYTIPSLPTFDADGNQIKYKVQFWDSATDQVVGPASVGAPNSDVFLHWSERYLVVSVGSGALVANVNVPWDPTGVIYDSLTRLPVTGAQITLSGPAGFDPATQLFGGTAKVTQTTGSDGVYQYILLPGFPLGTYTMTVTSPSGYKTGVSTIYPPESGAIDAPTGCVLSGSVCSIDPNSSASPPASGTTPYYYLAFTLTAANTNIDLVNDHIPLDPTTTGTTTLTVEKTASKTEADLGDFVNYTVTIGGVAENYTISNTKVVDTLPIGFHYVSGTLRLDGAAIADPIGATSPLSLSLGTIAPKTGGHLLTYRVRIDPGAQLGDGINRVSVTTDQGSGTASAKVTISDGVFTDKGFILGTVYADCNGDKLKEADEPGIPGVHLLLEDGTQVVTDGEGRYSLYGISPRTHVLRVDEHSLPRGSQLEVLDNRNANNPRSRFVDVQNGELARADFAVNACTPVFLSDLKKRVKASGGGASESDKALKGKFDADPNAQTSVRKGTASGVVGAGDQSDATDLDGSSQSSSAILDGLRLPAQSTVASQTTQSSSSASQTNSATTAQSTSTTTSAATSDIPQLQGQPVIPVTQAALTSDSGSTAPDTGDGPVPTPATPALPAEAVAGGRREEYSRIFVASQVPLEDLVPALDNKLGFIEPKDGDVIGQRQVRIRVKGTLGSTFVLRVNGKEIAGNRVGKKTELASTKVAAWEFIGIDLSPGKNEIEVAEVDPFGNTRHKEKISVFAPGDLSRIEVTAPKEAAADGITPVPVQVRLFDSAGIPVGSRVQVTLKTDAGNWRLPGAPTSGRETQAFVTGGAATFSIIPPNDAGSGTIDVSSGEIHQDVPIHWAPNLQPMIANGIVEGAINLHSLNLNGLQPARSYDGFEQEISSMSYNWGDGKDTAAARTSLYLKGKIKGDALLTLAYDSDKDMKDRVFRDISPDKYYPVYGDSSVKSFDAQTSGRLYVRVDKGSSYILYGDYNTDQMDPARKLSKYSRTLTGIKGQYDKGGIKAGGFVTQDTLRQVVIEIPANGTSGPFSIGSEIVENSEQVEVLVRDRNQPSVIISTQTLTRYADYDIDSYSGRITLKTPLSSYDENLNPQSLRITAELDTNGKPFWTYGAETVINVTKAIAFGVATVQDKNPDSPFSMNSATTTVKLGARTTLSGEVVRTDGVPTNSTTSSTSTSTTTGSVDTKIGMGERVELRHLGDDFAFSAEIAKTDNSFSNQSSSVTAGRTEASAKSSYNLSKTTKLVSEAVDTEDNSTGGARIGATLGVQQNFGDGYSGELGARISHETTDPATTDSTGTTPNDVRSVRAKLSAPVFGVKGASMFGEVEQDVADTTKRALGIGGEYKIEGFGKAYVKEYLEDTLGSSYALNDTTSRGTTLVGVTGDYMEGGQLYSEYRVNDALDGQSAQAAVGLNNGFKLADGLRLTTKIERVSTVSGTNADATAIGTGLEYTKSEWWKGSIRAEGSHGVATDTGLLSSGLALKINKDWTGLARSSYDISRTSTDGSEQSRTRLQTGLAYRDTATNKLFVLSLLEWRDENLVYGTTPELDSKNSAYIFSVHANYQLARALTLSGRYATKWELDDTDGISTTSLTTLLMGRVTYDIWDRWDVSFQGSTLFGGASQQFGVGTELGYRVTDDLWLSGGYNFIGFRDKDLTGSDVTDRGVFVRIRFKFDEDILPSFLVPKE